MHSDSDNHREEDTNTLRKLEESLWCADTRFDDTLMDKIFAADFIEFGRSGRIYTRSDLILTPEQKRGINATLPLPEFKARVLSDDIAQVTYISEIKRDGHLERANRSSIWRRTTNGWELCFHQGTPVE